MGRTWHNASKMVNAGANSGVNIPVPVAKDASLSKAKAYGWSGGFSRFRDERECFVHKG